jgi:3-hydroxybutyryl-CoA dehydratase
MTMNLAELKAGVKIPEIRRSITQANINRYAEASGDFNPIHVDEEYARNTSLGGTIAHGMMVLAYVSQLMTNAFGQDWLSGGRLNVRFKTPARPGDTVTVNGEINSVEEQNGERQVVCNVLVSNQDDEAIITGKATVRVKTKGQNKSGR